MDKLKMHSPDLVAQNIDKIAELFPNCITEDQDEKGKVRRVVDFDLLRQELSVGLVEGPRERYTLTWPGKNEAILTANAPIAKTLRPCEEESVDFENTKNLFIEGDNLDVLKLLQETYLNKVKMIYIDPPYNTGEDFLYRDNFTGDKAEFELSTEQKDVDGNRLVQNLESNGRFHSDWLTMMYPRLKLARNLLREDGVIFISIDENEVHNLRKMCDEIFGEENFITNFIWEKRTNRENRKMVSTRHDNILCFCRDIGKKDHVISQLPMSDEALSRYKNPDNDPRGLWKSDPATAQAGHGTKNQFYVFTAPNGKEHHLQSGRCWLYTKEVLEESARDGRIWFGKDGNGVPRVKTYLNAKERGLTPETIWFASDASTNESSKKYLKELFDGIAVFETPKPVELIKLAIKIGASDGIVLDFFAGTCATAEASIRGNRENQFIMIQFPEPCDEKSEAFKAGLKTIAEIGKERIRRAGKKINEENREKTKNLDIGFRVFKVDSSNMKDVYYTPDDLEQGQLDMFKDNIKPGRRPEDLLFQVFLDWGLDLSLPIAKETIGGKKVFFVDSNALLACFDSGITEELVKKLAKYQPLRVVFRDDGFGSDSIKINVEQIFKLLSPGTEVKSI